MQVLIMASPSRSHLIDAVVLHQNIVDRETEERAALEDVRRFLVNFRVTVVLCQELCAKYRLETLADAVDDTNST